MSIKHLLPRQGDCITCPDHPPQCTCSADQDCFFINRDCHNSCSRFICVAKSGSGGSKSSGGPSKGALAGGIVGALIFLGVAIAMWLWYRRSSRFSNLRRRMPLRPEDKPAPAATVLNRPDPTEKPPTVKSEYGSSSFRVYPTSSNTTIDLDPDTPVDGPISRRSSAAASNPFEDNNSIQTAGTEGTNVIPIALVSPDGRASSIGPSRPVRSPDLNLNLEHVNISNDSVPQRTGYAVSQISGISGVSSRNSYMSNASYSSDFLNEAPMIMTATKDTVRQVTRAVKPEFINAPPPSDHLKPPVAYTKRPSIGSPLATTSFGPSEIATPPASDDGHEIADPFNDKHASTMASPSASVTTFGQPSTPLPNQDPTDTEWETPAVPWVMSDDHSRPSSLSTQAGTVVEIENARRVNLGLSQVTGETSPQTAYFPRSPYRTTMGRIISPYSGVSEGTPLQEQQQIALAHAQARAKAQGLDESRRASGSSFLSAVSTSTRADSILESFPFVPPSPISNRPMRSPPVSPLAQQSFAQSQQQQRQTSSPTTPTQPTTRFSQDLTDAELVPPDRRFLGMSTASQLSTASSGLGSFPFQIESPQDPPIPTSGRQRASLDTLALTSDLASYPLGFDRESSLPYSKP